MFDLRDFIIKNLKKGYREGFFSATQVNIFALNYFTSGKISSEDVEEIAQITGFAGEENV